MGKVDWALAEASYVALKTTSYADIAKKFGVAKSTVVRRAVKYGWKKRREGYEAQRIGILEARTLEDRVAAEAKQLKQLRIAQKIINNQILELGLKQQNGKTLTPSERRAISELTTTLTKVITAERKIMGMTYKPIRVTDPEVIESVQVAMGLKPDPEDRKGYEKLKEAHMSLERMIVREKMLRRMMEQYDEHPRR